MDITTMSDADLAEHSIKVSEELARRADIARIPGQIEALSERLARHTSKSDAAVAAAQRGASKGITPVGR